MKSPANAKTRLTPCFSPRQRSRTAMAMFEGVVISADHANSVTNVYVATADAEVAAKANALGASVIEDRGLGDLNKALEISMLALSSDIPVLILPSDLPLITGSEIDRFVYGHRHENELGIVSDRHGRGTNALMFQPHAGFATLFGEDSYNRHVTAAHDAGFNVRAHISDEIAFDIDVPADILHLVRDYPLRAGLFANAGDDVEMMESVL